MTFILVMNPVKWAILMQCVPVGEIIKGNRR